MGNALCAALDLVRAGIPVFPARPNKAPLTEHGFKDATTDPAVIRAWLRRWHDALIGIRTGAESGLDVLDLDRQHGAAAWWSENRHRIPTTRTHRTRSGGLHLFFRSHPGLKCSTAKIGAGVDVRAANGCVIWWPAAGFPILADVPVTALADWPAWLLDLAMPKPKPLPTYTRPTEPLAGERAERYARAALLSAADRVAHAPAGQRNATLNAETFGLARFIGEGSLDPQHVADTLAVAALAAGLDRLEVVATVTSALAAGGVQ
ncbi:MAG: bifunctional DNA primase/polymerase [Magnetospirillum sp.]|nr:bifunctional DNA primase/polymerase [Magnetospirillum sp.]